LESLDFTKLFDIDYIFLSYVYITDPNYKSHQSTITF
jgi:hypothetical protein